MHRHILIATDGSPLAEKATAYGLSLAQSLGAKVTALIVEAPFSAHEVPEAQMRQMSEAVAQHAELIRTHAVQVLDRVTDAAKAAGIACETLHIEHRHPYQAIIATAKKKDCDLIVMASHGHSGLSTMLLGSVTNKVLAHTSIPVLVYR